MPVINEAKMKEQIRSGKFYKVYFIYGREEYLIRHYVDSLAKTAAGELAGFNLQKLRGNVPVSELQAAVEQLPVMHDIRCILAEDFDFDKPGAKESGELESLLEDLPRSSVLVFYYEAIAVKKTAKWKKVQKLIEKHGAVLQLDRLGTQQLQELLCKSAAKRGCRMHATAARKMIELCGNDLRTLQSELEKLCAFAADKEAIEETDIETVCVPSMEASVFQLSKDITAGRAQDAYALLDRLFYERAEPVAVLSALAMAYIDFYRAKAAEIGGMGFQQAAEEFGCPSWRMRGAAGTASRMTKDALRQCISVLNRADIGMKSSRVNSEIILQQTVAELLLCNRR